MLAHNILLAITATVASFSTASPLDKRAITVFTDGASASVTPQIATDSLSITSDIGGKADAVGAVAEVVSKVVALVQKMVDDDIRRRQVFTQQVVSSVRGQFPNMNVVMSNVGYSLSCTPAVEQGASYHAKVGSNVSYDVLVFGSGCTFVLKGDGGFENWAYIVTGCKADGKTITC